MLTKAQTLALIEFVSAYDTYMYEKLGFPH